MDRGWTGGTVHSRLSGQRIGNGDRIFLVFLKIHQLFIVVAEDDAAEYPVFDGFFQAVPFRAGGAAGILDAVPAGGQVNQRELVSADEDG